MTKPIVTIDAEGRNTLNLLLSTLMQGENGLRHVWNDTLHTAQFPSELAQERQVIDCIYILSSQGANPNRENVARLLTEIYRNPKPGDVLDRIFNTRSSEKYDSYDEQVKQNYSGFLAWWDNVKRDVAMQRANQIWNDPSNYTKEERWTRLSEIISDAAPVGLIRNIYATDEERYDAFMDYHLSMLARGDNAYPKFPFKRLNDKVGGIYPENPVLITAKSGRGKSQMAAYMAEWFAWTQGLYVLVITLESDIRQWETRFWARHFGIPGSAWGKTTYIRQSDGHSIAIPPANPYTSGWDSFISKQVKLDYVASRNLAGGRVVVERTPGWSITKLRKVVLDNQQKAERLGLPMLVIVDYLQKSVWSNMVGRVTELELLTRYANEWKVLAEQTKMYSIMFSQESDDGRDGDVKAYGSQIPHTVFQLHLSLQRPPIVQESRTAKIVNPEPVLDQQGRQMVNALYGERFFARDEGEYSGVNSYLKIMKANEGAKGNIPVLCESALANFVDPEIVHSQITTETGFKWNPWGLRRYPTIDLSPFTN